MSFILDALRKSDQDRQRASIPGVQTMHAPPAATGKRKLWPYALLIAATMVGMAVIQWPKPPASPPVALIRAPTQQPEIIAGPKMQASAPPINAPEPATVQTSEITVTENTEPAEQPAELEEAVEWIEITPHSPAVDSPPDVAAAPEKPTIPNVHALPPSTQRQLPAIAIAAQIYDSAPASRMALINGLSVREGSVIAPGLILESIGENGIVLNFQGQRFQMDVFQNWSGN